jgi:hypothetical protein
MNCVIMNCMKKESVVCPVCFEGYNESTTRPRIMYVCGHTLCDVCLSKIFESSSVENGKRMVTCPMCKEKNSSSSMASFPKNYALSELSGIHSKLANAYKDQICTTHKTKNFMICIDPKCTSVISNCVRCLVDKHSWCQFEYQFDWRDREEIIKLEPYKINTEEFDKRLDEMIVAHFQKIQAEIKKKISAIRSVIQNRISPLNYDFMISEKGAFDIDIEARNESRPALIFKLKRKEEFEKAYNTQNFDKLLNDLLHWNREVLNRHFQAILTPIGLRFL